MSLSKFWKKEGKTAQLAKELERAKDQLRRLDGIQHNFISSISHELRTPLTAIKEGVSILLDGALGKVTPRQEEFLRIIQRNTERLACLINDLLDLSQLEQGRLSFSRGSANLVQLLSEITDARSVLFDQKGLRLSTAILRDLPPVYMDSTRIFQAVSHLLDNALRFTPKDGSVVLEARLCGQGDWGIWHSHPYVRVTIRDTGVGVPREEKDKLFVKFQQLHRQPGPGYQGAGVGLAICREIIERHGGRIWAESELGKGSAFTFTLPVYTQDLELSTIFEECKVRAALEHNPLLLLIFSLDSHWQKQELTEDLIIELQDKIRSQIRTKDRLFYHSDEKTFYLFVISERPAELSIRQRFEEILKNFLPGAPLAWSFCPEEGEELSELRAKALQRIQAA